MKKNLLLASAALAVVFASISSHALKIEGDKSYAYIKVGERLEGIILKLNNLKEKIVNTGKLKNLTPDEEDRKKASLDKIDAVLEKAKEDLRRVKEQAINAIEIQSGKGIDMDSLDQLIEQSRDIAKELQMKSNKP